MSEASTIAAVAPAFIEAMDDYGLDGRKLALQAGVDPDRAREPDARYSAKQIASLWNAALAATGDEAVGVRVGRHVRPTSLHALGFAWLASDCLLDALRRLHRYHRLLNTGLEMVLTESGMTVTLDMWLTAPELKDLPFPADASSTAVIHMCRLSLREDFSPRAAEFKRAAPPDPRAWIDEVCSNLEFGTGRNRLVFDLKTLLEPLPGTNTELALANEQIAAAYLARFDRDNVTVQVRHRLVEMLPAGRVSQDSVAESLNVSARTLQRRLETEGTTFTDLTDETRSELARQYLAQPHYSVTQVAYLLGFSEPSNFARAFRRWTGRSPTQYQQSAA